VELKLQISFLQALVRSPALMHNPTVRLGLLKADLDSFRQNQDRAYRSARMGAPVPATAFRLLSTNVARCMSVLGCVLRFQQVEDISKRMAGLASHYFKFESASTPRPDLSHSRPNRWSIVLSLDSTPSIHAQLFHSGWGKIFQR
jgi:hypothetical protein